MKDNIKNAVKIIEQKLKQNSPEILTGIGITGMLTSTILAVKYTPKALDLIHEAEYTKGEELNRKEVIKTCWKCYIPSALVATASVGCLIGANTVNSKRKTALAAACKITQSAFTEYKDKVKEVIGEEKEQEIRDKVAKNKIDKNPTSSEVIVTGNGSVLCYDSISGRYFQSDVETIRKAENTLNRRLMNDIYCSLNDFYDLLGLSYTSIGEEVGWNVDDGMIEIEFSSIISEDNKPCIVIDYSVSPKNNYQNLI